MKKKIIAGITLLAGVLATACAPGGIDDESLSQPGENSSQGGGTTSSSSGSTFKYKGKNVLDNLGPETGEITFQVGGGSTEYTLFDRLVTRFEQLNPGITVKQVSINDSDVLYTQLAGGNAPDVIQVESHNFGAWAKAGALQAIQPFAKDDADLPYDDYWPQALEMYSFNTTTGIRGNTDLFSLPKDFGVNGVFVNEKLVNAALNDGRITQTEHDKVFDQDNPMTYEEYIDIAHKMTVYTGGADSIYGSNRIYWESYMWSLEDDILTSNYKLNNTSENVKKVFEYSKSMIDPNSEYFCSPYTASASTSSADEMSLFNSGKIAMYWSGRWNVPTYDATNINYRCIPCPVADLGGGKKGISTGWCATIGYSISRNCVKTKMAYKLIKFLASREAYLIMNELNYAVPGLKSLCKEPEFADPKTNNGSRRLDAKSAQTFFNLAENARLNNAARFTTNKWITIFEDSLELYFTGEYESVEEFLNTVKPQVDAALKQSDPQLFR